MGLQEFCSCRQMHTLRQLWARCSSPSLCAPWDSCVPRRELCALWAACRCLCTMETAACHRDSCVPCGQLCSLQTAVCTADSWTTAKASGHHQLCVPAYSSVCETEKVIMSILLSDIICCLLSCQESLVWCYLAITEVLLELCPAPTPVAVFMVTLWASCLWDLSSALASVLEAVMVQTSERKEHRPSSLLARKTVQVMLTCICFSPDFFFFFLSLFSSLRSLKTHWLLMQSLTHHKYHCSWICLRKWLAQDSHRDSH